MPDYVEYQYDFTGPAKTLNVVAPQVFALAGALTPQTRVLDVGSGKGALAGMFLERGCKVIGIDLSTAGITYAREKFPKGRFEQIPADDKIIENLGEPPFDLVVSTEVIEHIPYPRTYARGLFNAVKPGGRVILSTPYHGYLKNMAISLTNKWDWHWNVFFDGGHIKFFSRKSMSRLLTETGFTNLQFRGAGRFPYLWMSMVMSGDKPL